MISREELVELKKRKNINLYYLEKEYLQYIFLNAISKFAEGVVFKGGTCLRICYGLERASEDLDFSTSFSLKQIREIVDKCLKNFELLGIEYFGLVEKEFEGNIRVEVKLKGPLFNGNLNSANSLKIDFNKNKVYHKNAVVISQIFSDVPSFVFVALAEKEILAEKIRAIANRKQARDLYDLWVLIKKNTPVDRDLIKKKLKEEDVSLKNVRLISREMYESDLRNLISFVPDYEQVKREILELFEKIK